MAVLPQPLDQFLILNGLERDAPLVAGAALTRSSPNEREAARAAGLTRPRSSPRLTTGQAREIRELLGPYGVEASAPASSASPSPRRPATLSSPTRCSRRERPRARFAACRRSPTIPAFASRRSTARPAFIPRAGRARARISPPRWRASRRELEARGVAKPWRAHFVSALAIAWPDGQVETFEGRVDGELVFPPRGTAGFGYDPIFRPDGHDRTFGEMTAEEKHGLPADGSLALSHRARAFQKFARAYL